MIQHQVHQLAVEIETQHPDQAEPLEALSFWQQGELAELLARVFDRLLPGDSLLQIEQLDLELTLEMDRLAQAELEAVLTEQIEAELERLLLLQLDQVAQTGLEADSSDTVETQVQQPRSNQPVVVSAASLQWRGLWHYLCRGVLPWGWRMTDLQQAAPALLDRHRSQVLALLSASSTATQVLPRLRTLPGGDDLIRGAVLPESDTAASEHRERAEHLQETRREKVTRLRRLEGQLVQALVAGDGLWLRQHWPHLLQEVGMFLRQVRRWLRQGDVRARLIPVMDDRQLNSLTEQLSPDAAPFISRLVARPEWFASVITRTAHWQQEISSTRLRDPLWEYSLAFLLSDRGSQFNRESYLGSLLYALAGRYNLEPEVLRQGMIAALKRADYGNALRDQLLAPLQRLGPTQRETAAETPQSPYQQLLERLVSTTDRRSVLEQTVQQALQHTPGLLLRVLRQLRGAAQLPARLADGLSANTVQRLASLLEPGSHVLSCALLDERLLSSTSLPPCSPTRRRQLLAQGLLNYLLVEQQSGFNPARCLLAALRPQAPFTGLQVYELLARWSAAPAWPEELKRASEALLAWGGVEEGETPTGLKAGSFRRQQLSQMLVRGDFSRLAELSQGLDDQTEKALAEQLRRYGRRPVIRQRLLQRCPTVQRRALLALLCPGQTEALQLLLDSANLLVEQGDRAMQVWQALLDYLLLDAPLIIRPSEALASLMYQQSRICGVTPGEWLDNLNTRLQHRSGPPGLRALALQLVKQQQGRRADPLGRIRRLLAQRTPTGNARVTAVQVALQALNREQLIALLTEHSRDRQRLLSALQYQIPHTLIEQLRPGGVALVGTVIEPESAWQRALSTLLGRPLDLKASLLEPLLLLITDRSLSDRMLVNSLLVTLSDQFDLEEVRLLESLHQALQCSSGPGERLLMPLVDQRIQRLARWAAGQRHSGVLSAAAMRLVAYLEGDVTAMPVIRNRALVSGLQSIAASQPVARRLWRGLQQQRHEPLPLFRRLSPLQWLLTLEVLLPQVSAAGRSVSFMQTLRQQARACQLQPSFMLQLLTSLLREEVVDFERFLQPVSLPDQEMLPQPVPERPVLDKAAGGLIKQGLHWLRTGRALSQSELAALRSLLMQLVRQRASRLWPLLAQNIRDRSSVARLHALLGEGELYSLLELRYPRQLPMLLPLLVLLAEQLAVKRRESTSVIAGQLQQSLLEQLLLMGRPLLIPMILVPLVMETLEAADADQPQLDGAEQCRLLIDQLKQLDEPEAQVLADHLETGMESQARSETDWHDAEPVLPTLEPGERILIENAGMVMAAPFLNGLWQKLELQNEAGAFPPEQAPLAVSLLQYLATGQAQAPECDLTLNKLLCGIALETPVAAVALTAEQQALVDSLISAINQHWGASPNTSVSGFRQSFFQRKGVLERTEAGWNLQVQYHSIDILRSAREIPWGFSLIRFSWMPEPIHVQWDRSTEYLPGC